MAGCPAFYVKYLIKKDDEEHHEKNDEKKNKTDDEKNNEKDDEHTECHYALYVQTRPWGQGLLAACCNKVPDSQGEELCMMKVKGFAPDQGPNSKNCIKKDIGDVHYTAIVAAEQAVQGIATHVNSGANSPYLMSRVGSVVNSIILEPQSLSEAPSRPASVDGGDTTGSSRSSSTSSTKSPPALANRQLGWRNADKVERTIRAYLDKQMKALRKAEERLDYEMSLSHLAFSNAQSAAQSVAPSATQSTVLPPQLQTQVPGHQQQRLPTRSSAASSVFVPSTATSANASAVGADAWDEYDERFMSATPFSTTSHGYRGAAQSYPQSQVGQALSHSEWLETEGVIQARAELEPLRSWRKPDCKKLMKSTISALKASKVIIKFGSASSDGEDCDPKGEQATDSSDGDSASSSIGIFYNDDDNSSMGGSDSHDGKSRSDSDSRINDKSRSDGDSRIDGQANEQNGSHDVSKDNKLSSNLQDNGNNGDIPRDHKLDNHDILIRNDGGNAPK